MIRLAVAADLPRLQIMGAKFFDATGFDKWFRWNPRTFAKAISNFMASDNAVVLVGEGNLPSPYGYRSVVAMAAALAYPCWLDEDSLTAQELFWWVEPDHRGGPFGSALCQGLEDWARGQGCLTMEMGALESMRPDVLAAAYARKGYGPKERVFCKRL